MTPPSETLHSNAARAWLRGLIALSLAAAASPGRAQETQAPSWIIPDVAAAARAEGSLTVYSSMNEQEGLPLWKMFEDATGVKVNYVRSSDSIILSRIAIENRARQRSWDVAVTPR
jgi:spermidine/putrescine-binding protein